MSTVDTIITNCFTVVKHGFNFVAFNKAEKRAVTEWKQFQHEAQTEEHHKEQIKLLKRGKADTIALINGFNGLVAFDFDAVDKASKPIPEHVVREVAERLGLPWPYFWSWRSVSGAGWHFWVVVPDLPDSISLRIVNAEKLKEIGISSTSFVRALEIRAWRLCTAIPPNITIPEEPPAEVTWYSIRNTFGFEERLQTQQKPELRELTPRDKVYAEGAFQNALSQIKDAPEGERNTTLYYQARELFRFCLAGALDEQTVTEALDKASTLRNDRKEERERIATIRSAKKNAERLGPRYAPNNDNHNNNVAMTKSDTKEQQQQNENLPFIDAIEKRMLDEGYTFYLNTENGEYFIQYKDSPARRLEDHDLGMFKKWSKNRNYPLYAAELAIIGIADRNKISPIHDGLLSLQWDGKQNIAKVASCLRVSDNLPQELSEKWLTYWLLKAIGKVLAQEQNIVFVLEGGQGIGKSHFVKWLGDIFPNSYLEEHIDPHNKDCLLNLTRHLVWEICELEKTTRKHDAAALKHFITRSTVTVRPAYGRTSITRPVLASLIATTNNPASGYLTDETGNRRFLILPVSEIDWSYTDIDPRQVWAEALYRWKSGERGVLSKEDVALRESIASDRMMTGLLDVWLQRYLVITKNEHDTLTSADIAEFLEDKNLKIGGTERSQATAIGMALGRLGIPKERRLLSNGTRFRVWVGVKLSDTKSQFVISNNNNDDTPPDRTPPEPAPTQSSGSNDNNEVVQPDRNNENGKEMNYTASQNIVWLETAQDVEQALRDIMSQQTVGLDLETTGLNPREHRIRLVQLATPNAVYMLDAFKTNIHLLDKLFEVKEGPVLAGHFLEFDLTFLRNSGIEISTGSRLFDTYIASKLLSAGLDDKKPRTEKISHSLRAVVERYLGVNIDKKEQKSDWSGELTQEQIQYAANDAAILLSLADVLSEALYEAELTTAASIEMRALPAVVWMKDTGVYFDSNKWKDIYNQNSETLEKLSRELAELAGKEINWNSHEQLKELLAERGIDVENTQEKTLKPYAEQDKFVAKLLTYKKLSKRTSSFGLEFLNHVSPDSRIRFNLQQIGTSTGRMSCENPNVQQIPRDSEYRQCFTAPPGRTLIKADYSQIELRIAAKIANDRRMLNAYENKEDLHELTARLVLGVHKVEKSDRQKAKALNFGLLYGMGATGLRNYAAANYNVDWTEEEAKEFRNRFFKAYQGLKRWHNKVWQNSNEKTTRTLSKRRRLNVESFTEKLNTPVQGTGADGLKAALGLMWDTRILRSSAVPVLAVHDEIVVECNEEDAEAVKEWVERCMVQGMKQFLKNVPVEVDAVITKTWAGK